MSKQPETLFKEKVMRRLEAYPMVYVFKLQQVAKVGDPDMLLCVGGVFVAWELKVKKNKATKLQAYKLAKIRAAGGIAHVVTPENIDLMFKELDSILTGRPQFS